MSTPYMLTEIEDIVREWAGVPIYLITLTYSPIFQPIAQREADGQLEIYLRDLRVACEEIGIPLRYVSGGYRKPSGYDVVHYIVLPESIPPGMAAKLWTKGPTRFEYLEGIRAALLRLRRRPNLARTRRII